MEASGGSKQRNTKYLRKAMIITMCFIATAITTMKVVFSILFHEYHCYCYNSLHSNTILVLGLLGLVAKALKELL